MELLTLTISALGWTGLTALGGIVEGKSDYTLNRVSKRLLDNLRSNRLEENHELQRAVYRAYLQATLQTCALRAGHLGIDVDKLILSRGNRPVGMFSAVEATWLIPVVRDLREKIRRLERGHIDLPSSVANDELSRLTDKLELLLEPRGEAARNRIDDIRGHICERVITDLDGDYRELHGPVPDGLSRVIHERWFELMCAFFQSAMKKDPAIEIFFQSKLLAGIAVELEDGKSMQVTAAEIRGQLERLGGEMCSKIDQSIGLLESQQGHLDRIEFDFLLPMLALARDGEARQAMIESLIADAFSTVQEIGRDVKEIKDALPGVKIVRERERIIGAPNLNVEIFDREEECATLLETLSDERGCSAIVIVAPGGFGKTGLLTKVIQQVRGEEGDSAPTIMYIECKDGRATLARLFTDAEEVIGRRGVLQQLYARDDLTREQKIGALLGEMSRVGSVWIMMDNFEDLLDEGCAIRDEELRVFIERCLALDHRVRVIMAARDRPVIGGRHRPVVLEGIATALKAGLPEDDAVAYLRREGANCGLKEAPEELLRGFVRRVHGIPMALVRVVGHLSDYVYPRVTLEKLMEDKDRFEDFQRSDFEKGLRRLISEQLDRQSAEGMTVLKALAFLGGAVAEPVLEPLLSQQDLDRALHRLTANRLVDAERDIRGINHYSLHPIISEVVGERIGRYRDETDRVLTEGYADICLGKGNEAQDKARIRLALALAECAEKVYHYLINTTGRVDLSNDRASALNNKGNALSNLGRLQEAIDCYDQAIAIRKRLVEEEHRDELANALAAALMNKGVALDSQGKLQEAIDCYDQAIAIYSRLVEEEHRDELANALATALMNKGISLRNLGRLQEAIDCYDQAIAIYSRLVEEEHRDELANALATALMNKALLLEKTENWDEALALYEEAITLQKKCILKAGMIHLLPSLLKTIRYRLMTLFDLGRWAEAASDVSLFLDCYDSLNEDAPRDATQSELKLFIGVLKSRNSDDMDKLLAALDRDADRLRVEELRLNRGF